MGSELVLYDSPGSPCARRVRITLLEKGLAWDTVVVDLSRMEQKKPEYLRINPNGVVPTLVHDAHAVYESNVITEYLDDVFPEVPLYPKDPWERAQVKLWQSFELSLAKDYRPMMYQRLLGPMVRLTRTLDEALEIARRSTTNPFDLEWERKVWSLTVLTPEEESSLAARLYRRVEVLEAALASSDFLVGDRFTQAEISVFPRLRMYPFVQLPIAEQRYPRVAAWMARLEQRSSFDASLFSAERGMQKLGDTRIVPWIAAQLKKSSPTLLDRAGLAVARRFFQRTLRWRDSVASARADTRVRKAGRPGLPESADCTQPRPVGTVRPAPDARSLILYGSPLSPCSLRVEIVLGLLGLKWTTRPIDLARGEQKQPEMLRLNPNGEVPVLLDGERVLYDSALISEYLCATFGEAEDAALYPTDPFALAQTKMWIAFDQALHKEWRPLLFARLGSEPLQPSEADLLRHEIERKLERIEEALRPTGHLVGEALTAADIAWFSRVELLPHAGIQLDADRFPAIAAWHERLRSRLM